MKKGFWRRVGWMGMAILPLLASLVLQIIIAIVIYLAAIVYAIAFQGGFDMADPWLFQQQTMDLMLSRGVNVSILVIYHLLGVVVFGIWYYFGCGRPNPQKPGKVFLGKALPVTILIGLFMDISASAFLLSAEYIFPDLIRQYEELMEAAGLGTDPLVILASILLAPVGEELLCRGVIFHYAKKAVEGMKNQKAAFWIANTTQALMFGILHGNLVQGFYAFCIGLCLGWLRWRYNSLYPSMLAHFIVNFSSTFLLGYLFYFIPETLAVYLAVMIVGIVGIVLVMLWDKKNEQAHSASS